MNQAILNAKGNYGFVGFFLGDVFMKKFFKITLFLLVAAIFATFFVACKKDGLTLTYIGADIKTEKGITQKYKIDCSAGQGYKIIAPESYLRTVNGKTQKFIAWTDDEGKSYVAGQDIFIDKTSVTLTADWRDAYALCFKSGDESVSPATEYYATGEVYKFKQPESVSQDFKRDGYRFNEWSDGQNTYKAGDSFPVGQNDVTFTAQWTKVYKITFEKGDLQTTVAGNAPAIEPRAKGENFKVPANGFIAAGYEFKGWKCLNNGKTYQAEDYFALSDDVISDGGITFVAQWEKTPVSETDNFIFNEYADGYGIKLNPTAKPNITKNLVLPSTFNGKSVTKIEKNGFAKLNIVSVTIPSSVKQISDEAFADCSSLNTVFGCENVETIGAESFKGCVSLSILNKDNLAGTLDLDGVKSIGEYAFKGCKFTTIKITSSLTQIGNAAFAENKKIASFDVIDNDKFVGGVYLVEKATKTLITYAAACPDKTFDFTGKDILKIGDYAFSYAVNLNAVTLNDALTSIGSFAFARCTNLSEVRQDDDNALTSIGEAAFLNCSGITSFYIGKHLNTLALDAFSGCIALGDIYCNTSNDTFESSDGNLYNKGKTTLLIFSPNKSSAGFDIPQTVTKISDYAFAGNTRLETVSKIGSGTISVGNGAFSGCSALTSITFWDNIDNIGQYAFALCTKLKSVTMGKNLTTLGKYAFEGCSSLENIQFNSECKLDAIPQYAFSGTQITALTLGDSIKTVCSYAFFGCDKLKTVNFNKVQKVESFAFKDCYGADEAASIKEVALPASLVDFDPRAFDGCKYITNYKVSQDNAAYAAKDDLYFLSDGTPVAVGCVYSKDGKTLVVAPASLPLDLLLKGTTETIGKYAFAGSNASSIDAKQSAIKIIEEGAFKGCYLLSKIELPSSVTAIKQQAFYGCNLLSLVTFDGNHSLEEIGDCAFYDCLKLNLYLKGNKIPTVEETAFGLSQQAQETSYRPVIYVESNLVQTLKIKWSFVAEYIRALN